MSKVFIDYGHGGTDPGALGNGLKEKDLTLAIGKKVDAILRANSVITYNSRTTDTTVSLPQRSSKANSQSIDAFISIHINAFKDPNANGVETFSYPGSTQGARLARAIQSSLIGAQLFRSNRGTKTANFHVLRETKAPAALVELGFITNSLDAQVLKTRIDEIANAVASGILSFLGKNNIVTNPSPITSTPILGRSTGTVQQMKEWARRKGATKLFIDLAPKFYNISINSGVDPLVTYTQSAKETGYMKFGGVLNASFNNPCGLKATAGGSNTDPKAHQRFRNWEEGIQAQVDHLALYAGATGYPKASTPDPRHFPYLKGTATTVESLGGKWAPSKTYGNELVQLINEIKAIPMVKDPDEVDIRVNLLGTLLTVKGKFKNNTNYLILGDIEVPIRNIFESMGLTVTWKNGIVEVTK